MSKWGVKSTDLNMTAFLLRVKKGIPKEVVNAIILPHIKIGKQLWRFFRTRLRYMYASYYWATRFGWKRRFQPVAWYTTRWHMYSANFRIPMSFVNLGPYMHLITNPPPKPPYVPLF